MSSLSYLPMIKKRQDMHCMRSVYNIRSECWCENESNNTLGVLESSKMVECRNMLLNLRFNEHDYGHRVSCF